MICRFNLIPCPVFPQIFVNVSGTPYDLPICTHPSLSVIEATPVPRLVSNKGKPVLALHSLLSPQSFVRTTLYSFRNKFFHNHIFVVIIKITR